MVLTSNETKSYCNFKSLMRVKNKPKQSQSFDKLHSARAHGRGQDKFEMAEDRRRNTEDRRKKIENKANLFRIE